MRAARPRQLLHDTVVELEHLPLPELEKLRLPLLLRDALVERALDGLPVGEAAQRDVDCTLKLSGRESTM